MPSKLFRFALNDTGVSLSCISLATFLVSEADNPKLSFRIEFVDHPECFAEYEQGCLKFAGMKSAYQKQIEEVLAENNVPISEFRSQTETFITPAGDALINGDEKIFVGTRIDFQSLRNLFPGLTDGKNAQQGEVCNPN